MIFEAPSWNPILGGFWKDFWWILVGFLGGIWGAVRDPEPPFSEQPVPEPLVPETPLPEPSFPEMQVTARGK